MSSWLNDTSFDMLAADRLTTDHIVGPYAKNEHGIRHKVVMIMVLLFICLISMDWKDSNLQTNDSLEIGSEDRGLCRNFKGSDLLRASAC